MCRAHLLQVDVGLPDVLHAVLGEGGVRQQEARQRFIVPQKMLQPEACGRENRSEKPDSAPPPGDLTALCFNVLVPTKQRCHLHRGRGRSRSQLMAPQEERG